MGWYNRQVFPRLLDWVMAGEPFVTYRKQVLANVEGEVLEIGFGTGLNLAYYPEAVSALTVIDPNPGMSAIAQPRLSASDLSVTSQSLRGEALSMADNTFDWVVSTWTLCSIENIDQALSEIQRVLKPGGKFTFIEHGRSPEPGIRTWQHRITPLQKRIADGCHLDRAIADLVEDYLTLESLETFYAPTMPKISGYFYQGIATKLC
ncbi:class I SAM-dependent methyltransferase [Oscillatoria sp. CS-180]|uniref:class I SAM-dependent methyltransferase n=1 Tax=Oscillatoria sp. CS-180 TaxID=3021720 RepID=UPI00232C9BF4|nr:class I SAM-dependent methyltransferase [Oscillatoria sp. CS-180]MDB9526177.1 class I SAM-dependent methyltransferase [Oscillatoria sp. CS-180]